MAVKMNLVDATTTQRLLSWLVDMVPVLILSVIFLPMISAKMLQALTVPEVMGDIMGIYATYALLSLAYTVFVWWWEATAGKTPGNLVLGVRTTNLEGGAPGWGKTIGRRLLIAVAGIIPLAGSILMVISNQFDSNGKKQGWHDKAAGTLVLDIKAGRDPLSTGGKQGPESFAPQPAAGQDSAVANVRQPAAEQAPAVTNVPVQKTDGPLEKEVAVIDSVPGAVRSPLPEPEPQPAQQPEPQPEPQPQAELSDQHVSGADADEEEGYTRIRSTAPAGLHLEFDDQKCIELDGTILLGRNPSHGEGDIGVRLVVLDDPERSVSKTHLLVQPGAGCIWVTDRGSANGSSIVDAQGAVRALEPGKPEQALAGQTVYLGDRYFHVEQP